MPKSLTISGKTFRSIKEAKDYVRPIYDQLRDSKGMLTSGEEFLFMEDLLKKYCDPYPEYKISDKIVGFEVKEKSHNTGGGTYSSTFAFYAIFENSQKRDFSYSGAISDIAKIQNM